MKRTTLALAALFLAFHLPYLPQSLEDLDSINFALGIRRFDVARHQPHPPGYPVFIALAKAVHTVVPSEARALAILSVLAGSLAALALVVFFGRLDPDDPGAQPRALAATVLTISAPLYWLTSVRPLSDMTGFAAAVGVQALAMSAAGVWGITAASFLSAFGMGLRSQVAWLTVPLLALTIWRRLRSTPASGEHPAFRRATVAWPALAFLTGLLVWAVPLVILTGGPAAYWRALFNQGSEDLTNIVMLWTTHTPREVVLAFYYAFVAPWAVPAVAGAILTVAALGAVRGLWRRSNALLTLAVAFGPYLLFDLVFQETVTTRYALPLVAPIAYLAACGLELLGPTAALVALVAVSAFDAHIGGTTVAAYARQPSPVFRMLDGMKDEASIAGPTPVLAMHRREMFDLRRPFDWNGPPGVAARLPTPPKHEWLEVVKYWNGGGRRPVWFVADPLRSDLALLGIRDRPASFRWTLDYPVLLGGTRPNEMDWYVVNPPDWYLGEGWSLTPETAGVAGEDRRGPGYAPVEGWIRRWSTPATLMIGGRNLSSSGSVHLRVAVDERVVDQEEVGPGFFLRMIELPADGRTGRGDYARVAVSADAVGVSIEQFDAGPEDRVLVGYDDGWHEREYDPATGRLWRWTSDHGMLRVRSRRQALVLTLEGEVEAAAKSRVTIRIGDRIVAAQDIGRTFSIRQIMPQNFVVAGDNAITVTTDQTYVPAERRMLSRDRRLLGLKVYECHVTPVS